MRSKGRLVSQNQVNMGDKPKSAKKRFRFRGAGNKKENGLIPDGCASSDPIEDGVCVSVQPMAPVGSSNHHKVYQLSNSDIINGGASHPPGGAASHCTDEISAAGQDDHQPLCTCPVPPDGKGMPERHRSEAADRGKASVNGCSGQPADVNRPEEVGGDGGNKVSVVAVIEGGRLSEGTSEQNVGGTSSSSNESSSSTSVCSVRPKVAATSTSTSTTAPSADAVLSEIMMRSPPRPLASHGDRSPSSHSLVSVASSTVTVDALADAPPFGPRLGSERQKQTLGEIIQQIDARCKSLLSVDDFTVLDPYQDLQFLSHQSRYSSDVHIKRRLIAKLVDSRVVDVFLRVFHSVHTVDYLGAEAPDGSPAQRMMSASQVVFDEKLDARSPNDGASGVQPAPPEESAAAEPVESAPRHDEKPVGTEESTSQADGAKEPVGNAVPLVCPAMKNLRAAVTLIWNTSDKSPILCEECIKKGVIQLLVTDLRDPRLATSELKDQHRLYLVKGYLAILNNIVCFFVDTREIFRDAGAIKVLQPYVKSQLLLVKTKAIMLLSYLINESENDVINASDKNIGFMIKMLEATLEKENHYSRKFAFWAVEVAAGLNRLGCFEANKDRIVEKGILPLYLELIQKPCNDDERLIAVQGLWIFSYSDKARNLILNDTEVLAALHSLQQSTTLRDELRRAVAGALWIIEGRRSGVGAVPKSPKLPAGAGHIYVSYHWTCLQFVARLRDKLRSFGYKVFVDTENMGTCGLPLETVFEGIEKACVLIICMSQKYKDSPSCRNEVEHALRLRRDIIPLRLQQKYNPDGWLASVTNTKLIFDFSRDENLENVTMALIRELGPRGKSKSSLAAAAAAASVVSVEQASRSPSNQSVASGGQSLPNDMVASRLVHWTESDVSHWLMDNGLTSAIDRFNSVNGELLYEMKKMHQVAPESFFFMLRSELGFDWITQLKFTKALDKL